MKESDIRPRRLFDRFLKLAGRDAARLLARRAGFVEVACPACASRRRALGLRKLGYAYAECLACGSLYVSPRPSPEQLHWYYTAGDSARFWCTNFYKETAEARREAMFKPRAELVARLARERGIGRRASFVDAGSGYGIFLQEVRKLKLFRSVTGIEPGPALARRCRRLGFPVVAKPVEEVAPEELSADFMTAFEVLEHVFSPLAFLSAVRRLLRPGGMCLFTTLASSGFDIQTLWERSKSVFPPQHLNLMSVEGLRRLTARAGLEVLDLSTPGRLDVDIVVNMATIHRISLPRFIKSIVASPAPVRERFQTFLADNLLSSHARILARRR